MMEMMMEEAQGAMRSKKLAQIIKGRRTKRQRPVSPLTLAITSSSSDPEESEGERERMCNNNTLLLSPSTSIDFTEGSGEEEDMANCLILLAQGPQTRRFSEPAAAINAPSSCKVAAALYVYQCKTCNRCFPSFQALGGHRASHKKPKAINEEKKAPVTVTTQEEEDQLNNMSTTLSLQIPHRGLCGTIKSNKIHECSICGAEFSSGQALGGHMRRHRAFSGTSTTPAAPSTTMSLGTSSPESQESKKPRNDLQFDLNLPAPEDDIRETKFQFASKEQILVFSASSLVDCHY